MIALWILLTAMTVAAAAVLAWPLFGSHATGNESNFALAVYRDQLREIARDAARGILNPSEVRTAKIEVERRILALDDAPKLKPVQKSAPVLTVTLALMLPLAALGLYLRLGSPSLPGEPAQSLSALAATNDAPSAAEIEAGMKLPASERQAMVDGMLENLAERLKAQPEDLEGWLRLGHASDALGRTDEARAAWAKAAQLAPNRLDVQLGYASATIAGVGDLTHGLPPAFVETVDKIHALAPENPLGLYFGGLVARANGDARAAREMWGKLLALIPPEAPSRESLQREIASLSPEVD